MDFDGETLGRQTFTGIPAIAIGENNWVKAAARLKEGSSVPAYRSFVLDAIYFAEAGDPVRSIIMACAAWETALREYLETAGAAKGQAYSLASNEQRIPRLFEYAKVARGGGLFYDESGTEKERKIIEKLPELRNKLLHRGQRSIPDGMAPDCANAVTHAIDWLFRDTHQ